MTMKSGGKETSDGRKNVKINNAAIRQKKKKLPQMAQKTQKNTD